MKNTLRFKICLIQTALILSFIGGANFVWAQFCPSQTQYSTDYAVLAGAVTDTGGDPNIQAWFDWGTSSVLGNSTPIQNLYVSSVPYRFCYTLNNLQPCTIYYYRAVIRNSSGTNYGTVNSFTTHCNSITNPLTVNCYASPNPANVNSLVNFYAVVTGGKGSYFYSWSGACSSYSSICSTSFNTGGNYFVNLTVTSGAESKSTVCSVNINPSTPSTSLNSAIVSNTRTVSNQSPVPIIAFSPENIRPGTIVTFDASRSYDPDGSIISYRWEINGELASNAISFKRALASGNYRVKLTVIDNNNTEVSKEVFINVGQTVYITRTKIITQNKPVVAKTASTQLVNLFLEPSYRVNICMPNEIQLTAVNNTFVNRKIVIEAQGESSDWFSPRTKTFILKPQETLIIKWQVGVPCNVEEKNYETNFLVTTPGGSYNFVTTFEAKKQNSAVSPLLGFIGLFGNSSSFWFLSSLLLIIIINIYLWYRFLRKKRKPMLISEK